MTDSVMERHYLWSRPKAALRYACYACFRPWAVVVLALYPLCRWFAALKQRRNDLWLSYF